MGKRIHSHAKHVVEYSTGMFNWAIEEVNKLLFYFCDECYGDDENSYFDERLEIPRESYVKMLERLHDESARKQYEEDEQTDLPNDLGWEEVIKNLQQLYDEADPDNDYIYLSWF